MQLIQKLIEFHKERKRASVDKFVVFLFPVLASVSLVLLGADYFMSLVFFFIIPSIYLSFRYPLYVQKSLLFSMIFGAPIALVIDYIAHVSFTWYVPNSILDPFRLYGVVPVENIIFAVSLTYFVVIFYEALLDHHLENNFLKPHIKYLFIFETVIVSIFSFLLIVFPKILNIDFFYLKLGLFLTLIPILATFFKFPKLINKFIVAGIYFFYVSIVYELTALYMGYWEFPARGDFVGHIGLIGFQFPLEEFIFWIILTAMAILAYFEFFDDDDK